MAPGREKATVSLMGINSMGKRMTRMSILIGAWLAAMPVYASLQREASMLTDKYRNNFSNVKTLKYEYQMTIITAGTTSGTQTVPREKVVWDKGKGKLKNKTLGANIKSYVAEAGTRKLEYCEGSASIMTDSLDDAASLAMTTPFPGWLWKPEWILPDKPAKVREEGAFLVLVSDDGHPRRELWLNRITGLLDHFEDTDMRGNVFRVVTCRDWEKVGGTMVPRSIDEEIKAKQGTYKRNIVLSVSQINQAIASDEYALP
jgi:hypothetical protein